MRSLIQRRRLLQAGFLAGVGSAGPTRSGIAQDMTGGDPLGSMQWPGLRSTYIGKAPMQFTQAVLLKGPVYAEDALNVPLLLDARALAQTGGGIDRLQVVVDRNPVREVLTYEPLRALPVLAFRIRMEQASPVRALVRTRDGAWHVGGTWVQAAGGGCTLPGATRSDGSWSQTLNQVQARYFPNVLEGGHRLRVRIMHPMDTGLVAGIPAFYIERLELQDSAHQPWFRLQLHEPVSENPILTFELRSKPPGTLRLVGNDNNGNRINAEVTA